MGKSNQNNNREKIIVITVFFIFGFYLYFNKKTANDDHNTSMTNNVGKDPTLPSNNTPIKKYQDSQKNQALNNRNPASTNSNSNLPTPDDATIELLERLEINYQTDAKKVGEDIWYVSDKYSNVPLHQYQSIMGTMKEKTALFAVVDLTQNLLHDEFPPTAVSYATGKIVQLTGDILLKYESDPDGIKNFLKKNFADIKFIDHPKLRNLKHLYMVLQNKNEVLKTFDELSKHVGKNNITHIELEKKEFQQPY